MKKYITMIFICLFLTVGLYAAEPQYGGKLKIIMQVGPTNVGYQPTMSFSDMVRVIIWAERLMMNDKKGNLDPCLAESWDIDKGANTITFHIRKGVKFHDGTDFDAKAARWNIQQLIDAKTLPDHSNIKSIEVLDKYTMRVNLKKYTYKVLYTLWRPMMFSPTAIEKNGKDWAIQHAVSTGPFKVVKFQQGSMTRLERFDGYWRKGKPYLDAIEIQEVKERATASAMIQAGQADFWYDVSYKEASDLQKLGYPVAAHATTMFIIVPDSANPNSPFADKRVREAVE